MAWRDSLQTASFRGVPFKFQSHDTAIGRRFSVHEYPGKDEAWVEDLGLRTGEFRIEGFVIGPDYFAARDALIAAIKKPGSGELIHPYLGKKNVMVTDCGLSENFEEGGMARFRMQFTVTSEPIYPANSNDTQAAVAAAGTNAMAAVTASFASRVSGWLSTASSYAQQGMSLFSGGLINGIVGIAGQYLPAGIVGTTLGSVSSLLNAGAAIGNLINNPASFATGLSGLIGQFQYTADTFVSASALAGSIPTIPDNAGLLYSSINPPATTAQTDAQDTINAAYAVLQQGNTASIGLQSINSATVQLTGDDNPLPAIQMLISGGQNIGIPLIGLNIPPTATISNDIAILIAIIADTDALGRRLAVIAQAQSSAAMTWPSYQAAIAMRTTIADALESEADSADDASALALYALRNAVIADISTRAADLRRLIIYTPKITQPAAVLSYRIYGDATQEDDIVSRNDIIHPGFALGGQPLEILSL